MGHLAGPVLLAQYGATRPPAMQKLEGSLVPFAPQRARTIFFVRGEALVLQQRPPDRHNGASRVRPFGETVGHETAKDSDSVLSTANTPTEQRKKLATMSTTDAARKAPGATKASAPAPKAEVPAKASTAPKPSTPAAKDAKAAVKAVAVAPEAAKTPAAKAATKASEPPKAAASAEAAKAPIKRVPIKLAKAAAKAPAAASPDNGENGDAKPKKAQRHQVTAVLGLDVSQARVTSHLKNNLGDAESETRIRELREQLKTAKEAGDDAQAKELKTQINEEAKKLVRISSDAPIALATAADIMVKELIRHSMLQAHAADRRMVEVSHIHTGQAVELSTWPLFRNLPSFEDYSEEAEEELKRKRAAANREAKEAREAKKSAAEQRPAANGTTPAQAKSGAKSAAKAPAPPVAPAPPAAEEPADTEEPENLEPHTGKTTFFTYVESALKKVKDEGPNFRNMRVSNRLREYCADLIAELIVRFSRLARIMVMDVMDVRTLTADHIVSIVRVLMVDEHREAAVIEETVAHIKEKLEVFREHVKVERQNKMSLLPEEKRKELEQKRTEQENLRMRKAASTAQLRAEEAASRAAELAEKVAHLPAAEAASEGDEAEDGNGQ